MIVKICGITNMEDALAAAEAGAAAIGFNFYDRSPRYIAPAAAAGIAAALPAAVWRVGVFVNESPDAIARIRRSVGLDVVQLHGDETPAEVPVGVRVWKALRVGQDFNPDIMENFDVEAFLLDSALPGLYGGTGRPVPWASVPHAGKRIILAGGLDDGNVAEAVRTVRPWGVDACSRLETRPGRKDHARMKRFVKAAIAELES